jgi:hypothetical protein
LGMFSSALVAFAMRAARKIVSAVKMKDRVKKLANFCMVVLFGVMYLLIDKKKHPYCQGGMLL